MNPVQPNPVNQISTPLKAAEGQLPNKGEPGQYCQYDNGCEVLAAVIAKESELTQSRPRTEAGAEESNLGSA